MIKLFDFSESQEQAFSAVNADEAIGLKIQLEVTKINRR